MGKPYVWNAESRESRPISRRRATRACYPYFQLSIRAPLHRTRPFATWASSLQSCKAPRILPLSRAVWPLARPNTLPTRPLCPSTTAVSKGFARRPCESHSPRRKLGGLRAWWAADIECDPPFFVLFSRLRGFLLLLWSAPLVECWVYRIDGDSKQQQLSTPSKVAIVHTQRPSRISVYPDGEHLAPEN